MPSWKKHKTRYFNATYCLKWGYALEIIPESHTNKWAL